MQTVQISACQFPVERMSSFDDFRWRVGWFLDQVPKDSHYVIFPELFTVGLLTTYPDLEHLSAADLTRIDEFTDEYKNLFRQAAPRPIPKPPLLRVVAKAMLLASPASSPIKPRRRYLSIGFFTILNQAKRKPGEETLWAVAHCEQ